MMFVAAGDVSCSVRRFAVLVFLLLLGLTGLLAAVAVTVVVIIVIVVVIIIIIAAVVVVIRFHVLLASYLFDL